MERERRGGNKLSKSEGKRVEGVVGNKDHKYREERLRKTTE